MINCRQCSKKPVAQTIGLCVDCLRDFSDGEGLVDLHAPVRKKFGLPPKPPKSAGGISCNLCANNCRMAPGEAGYCGLRWNENGRLAVAVSKRSALAHIYLDPLPTNCCAAWFCPGSRESGYNLAVFFYGCNFDCLFCQNASHKSVKGAPAIAEEEMVQAALDPHVRCVCFFGGSPEPQLPFALRVARRIIQESDNRKHICWEWNGCGNPALAEEAAELSAISGGTVKFDLKSFHPNITRALCGVDNHRAFDNFSRIAKLFPKENLLTATTLLVPYYVDKQEVDAIARFISGINSNIPYSLLVFHPDFFLDDLPITPKAQVEECLQIAEHYLSRVNIGNEHLLRYAK
ncbi:MAG: radical SAM protein [Proteobacteria bacterium]|nr:radical SAM protein [Pseudomonadota bacterium]